MWKAIHQNYTFHFSKVHMTVPHQYCQVYRFSTWWFSCTAFDNGNPSFSDIKRYTFEQNYGKKKAVGNM